ncbi:hypothetical protein [Leptolyngbya sp. 7M]|uniref:hypothetical protein n=1 Tax=Leptolyngbya sp. 7M TaxID=2812896 RepID=UPI0029390862|nr:hypothetical protein [Leptolyngbya sp. 7M]
MNLALQKFASAQIRREIQEIIEADNQPGLFYKVMYAIWQEDLLIVNANLLVWRGRTRLILYLLGPNENLIPEYLGQKIAEGVRQRLLGRQL